LTLKDRQTIQLC